MDNNTDSQQYRNRNAHPDLSAGESGRAKLLLSRLEKPKPGTVSRPFSGITNEEKKIRQSQVEGCVKLGMSVEQMVDFLPTLGLTLSRSQVYEYLGRMKLPKYYKPSEAAQSHHDWYTFRFFVRIAQDASLLGYRTHHLSKGTSPHESARFRPDFTFSVRYYRFFMELQLSDLTETRWSVKFKNYLRLRKSGMKFRALFVVDQKKDLAYCRSFARKVLEGSDSQGLFLFVHLNELKGSKNVAFDPVWLTPWGDSTSLLDYLPPPGQKPS